MSIRIMTAVWDMPMQAVDKLVALALADNANEAGLCWPSIATIARKCGCSERSVQRSIRQLQADGILKRDEIVGKGCKYTFNPRLCVTTDNASPVTETTHTPDCVSPKPSRTIIPSEPKGSSGKRARAENEFPCPEGVDQIDWQSLLANRKQQRAPMNAGAYRQILQKLERWSRDGWPPGPIVAYAVERGWRTVFETDEMKHGNAQHHIGKPRQTSDGGRASGWLS